MPGTLEDINSEVVVIGKVEEADDKITFYSTPSHKQFSFFKAKKSDGQATVAYENWQTYELHTGVAVMVKYDISGKYKNINSVKWFEPHTETEENKTSVTPAATPATNTGPTPTTKVPSAEGDEFNNIPESEKRILRSTALKCAAQACVGNPDEVLKHAEKFNDWLRGNPVDIPF